MRSIATNILFSAVALSLVSASVHAVVLTDDPAIRAAGSYTYYARGNAADQAIQEFTTAFYPGPTKHAATQWTNFRDGALVDDGTNAGAISFASGDLTDHTVTDAGSVAGWIDVLSPDSVSGGSTTGSFDIVFNLGSLCDISNVTVSYNNAAGFRFASGGTQTVYYAASFTPGVTTDEDLTKLADVASPTISGAGSMVFTDGGTVTAQYLIIRIDVTASTVIATNAGSQGIRLSEIAIEGTPVPEASSLAMLAVAGGLMVSRRRSE